MEEGAEVDFSCGSDRITEKNKGNFIIYITNLILFLRNLNFSNIELMLCDIDWWL